MTTCTATKRPNDLVQRMQGTRRTLQFGRQWPRTADHGRYLTMRALIIALALLGFSTFARSENPSEAEATTKRFAEALARFDVAPMVEELHSDVQQSCYTMAIHIIETTEDKAERADLLKALGVASPEEFKKLTPKV